MATTGAQDGMGDLLRGISDDVKTLARDEVELVRLELQHTGSLAVRELLVIVLGVIVASFGFAMLCTVAVVALAPVIPPLWLRLLIMAIVYIATGAGLVVGFQRRLKRETVAGFHRLAPEE